MTENIIFSIVLIQGTSMRSILNFLWRKKKTLRETPFAIAIKKCIRDSDRKR